MQALWHSLVCVRCNKVHGRKTRYAWDNEGQVHEYKESNIHHKCQKLSNDAREEQSSTVPDKRTTLCLGGSVLVSGC